MNSYHNTRMAFLLLSLAVNLVWCSNIYAQRTSSTDSLNRADAAAREAKRKLAANTQFQYFIVRAANHTYGYDVYADGNLYLHQLTVPGQAGNKGFADTTSAGKVARLVITKAKAGEIPPVIHKQELIKLGLMVE